MLNEREIGNMRTELNSLRRSANKRQQ